eukprot:c20368_g1_i2.p1 GENE.c20368_g1_i2~~c20368_g1_i2.p1  ORF type:complete len:226 (+),score=7.50 c20368_g1_i2:52-729(+)
MAAYGSQGDTRNGQENIPEGSIAHAIIDRLASDLNSDFSDLLSGISFPHTHVIGLCAHVIDQLAAKRTQSLDWNDISEQMGISINNCKAMWEHLRRPRTPPRRPEPRETFANNSIPTLASGPSLHDEGPLPPFSLHQMLTTRICHRLRRVWMGSHLPVFVNKSVLARLFSTSLTPFPARQRTCPRPLCPDPEAFWGERMKTATTQTLRPAGSGAAIHGTPARNVL